MKVLICHNYYKQKSGEDLVIQADIDLLRAGGYDVLQYRRDNTEIDTYTPSEYVRSATNAIYSRKSVKDIDEVVGTHSPDIAFVQNVFPLISPSVYHALFRRNIPIIQLVYNYRLICPAATLYTHGAICERCLGGNYLHAVRYRCFRNSRPLTCLYSISLGLHRYLGKLPMRISAYVTPDLFLKKKLVAAGYPAERMFTAHNPFQVSEYQPAYDHAGYFLFVGRLVPEKGILTAVRAMQRLPEHRLIVIGFGDAAPAAQQLADTNGSGNVTFAGPQYGAVLLDYLKGARAVLLPSEWYDNCPVILQQAFASAKPVIASEISGITEVIRHRENGLLFPPGDAAGLAEQMKALASDDALRLTLAAKARETAEREFVPERRLSILKQAITFACGTRPSHGLRRKAGS